MKMQKYYPVLFERAQALMNDVVWRQKWAEYVTRVRDNEYYNSLEVRLAWDFARLITSAVERSDMIHDCDADDKCFTTLMVKVCKDVKAIA